MKVSYFPGCTLKTKANGFENSLLASTAALGIELVEMPNWNCCGATFPLLADNVMDLAGPAHVLVDAWKEGDRVAVACTTCYNVLRRTNHVIRSDEAIREKLNFFIEADYTGALEVLDVLQIIRDDVGFETVAQAVRIPLTGLKVAAYYGCMVLRPPAEVAYEDPENPRALDDLSAAVGAEPVVYPHKGECCGAFLAIKSPETTAEMCYSILGSAGANGADIIVTNCPVCQFNLDKQQAALQERHTGFQPVPVLYYTQLLGLALGLDPSEFGFEKHYVDPKPVLERLGVTLTKTGDSVK
jgi:heterodisulfide reductase subunit B